MPHITHNWFPCSAWEPSILTLRVFGQAQTIGVRTRSAGTSMESPIWFHTERGNQSEPPRDRHQVLIAFPSDPPGDNIVGRCVFFVKWSPTAVPVIAKASFIHACICCQKPAESPGSFVAVSARTDSGDSRYGRSVFGRGRNRCDG